MVRQKPSPGGKVDSNSPKLWANLKTEEERRNLRFLEHQKDWEESTMTKNHLRIMALVLVCVMFLCMTACARDNAPETQPSEPADPMVRLYFHTETLTEDSCIRYEYEENWWEKPIFKVVKYQLTADGERENLTESVYVGDVVVTTNMYWPDEGKISMHYYQWDTTYSLYENGNVVYAQTDMESNGFGHICDVESNQYDEYGRITESKIQGFYKEGCGPMDGDPDGITEYTYGYMATESGSVGTCQFWDNCYAQFYFDSNYRHWRTEYYDENEMTRYYEYEYNSAGCMVKSTYHRIDDGHTTWEKYLYESVVVPLSVAERYPAFRWEYID